VPNHVAVLTLGEEEEHLPGAVICREADVCVQRPLVVDRAPAGGGIIVYVDALCDMSPRAGGG